MTTFLQQAAMPAALRRALDDAELDMDDLRKAAVTHIGAEDQELQTIRRFSVGNVVMWVLLAVVFYGIIAAVQDVGLQSIVDAITSATPAVLLLAFVLGQVPRAASAFAVSRAAPIPVPLGRLTLLEFAITFVNLAVPSTAARRCGRHPVLPSATDSTAPPPSASVGSTASPGSSPRSACSS